MTHSSFRGVPTRVVVLGTLLGANVLAGCGRSTAAPIHVLAAASLRETLTAIGREFEADERLSVTLSFGASNALAAQIRAGAPADVFVSADEAQMDSISKEGLLAPESRFDLLANRLVAVVRFDSKLDLGNPDRLLSREVTRVALADPSGVPAGVYAKQFLTSAGLYSAIERKVVRTNDVRGALTAVETGEADCGFVYRTDAAITKKVRVAFEVVGPHAPAIRYPAAQIKGGPAGDGAQRFLRYLRSDKATRVFAEAGFVLPT